MGSSNFKLKCEISQNTMIDLALIHERIIAELQKKKYQIIEQTDQTISFDDSRPRFEIRGMSSSKLDEGIFELIKSDQNTLRLTYFVSYLFPLFVTIGILILASFEGPVYLVLGAFLLITFVIEYTSQKDNATFFMNKIAGLEATKEIIEK